MADIDEAAAQRQDRLTAPVESGHSIVTLTTLATITTVCAILYIAKDLFLPLALGMLIAFVLTPLVNVLRRRGLRDMPAVILTVISAGALVAAFVLILAYQISQFGVNLPQYQGNVLDKIDPPKLNETLGAIAKAFNGRGEKIGQTLNVLFDQLRGTVYKLLKLVPLFQQDGELRLGINHFSLPCPGSYAARKPPSLTVVMALPSSGRPRSASSSPWRI